MSSDSDCFQERVAKLRNLRDQLCSKSVEWKAGFEVRDFVISELQDVLGELEAPHEKDPRCTWCKTRIENILRQLCALPEATTEEDNA
jgi:hypothetical protein